MTEVTVLYIARKANHPRFTRAFLRSLIQNEAGADYRLLFIMKGYEPGEQDPAFEELKHRLPCPASCLPLPDTTSPTQIFFDLGKSCDLFLALNSWSRILAPNWLSGYVKAFADEGCGIVGATGSFEATPNNPFPNLALRTNAFMMRGATVSQLDLSGIDSRAGNLQFEAGANNLTKQVMALGLQALVVDKMATLFAPPDWPSSRTFRSGAQENLLIADNRTAHYEFGSASRRSKLSRLAWGQDLSLPASALARLNSWLSWYYPDGAAGIPNLFSQRGLSPR